MSFLAKLVKECLFAADLFDLTPSTDELQLKLEPVDDASMLSLEGIFLYIVQVQ